MSKVNKTGAPRRKEADPESVKATGQIAPTPSSTNRYLVVRLGDDATKQRTYRIPAEYVLELLAWLQEREIKP